MKTFRSTASVIAVAVLLLGCSSARDNDSAARTQPLETWYAEAYVPLADLSVAYTALSRTSNDTMAEVARRPQVADIEQAAKTGLAVAAPASRPDIDTAYDRVMRDSLAIVGDVRGNAPAAFALDSAKTLKDMGDFDKLMEQTAESPAG